MAVVNQDRIFDAITTAQTMPLQQVGNLGGSLYARSIELDIFATGMWTLDIQGRTSTRATWHPISYYRTNVDGAGVLSHASLIVSWGASEPQQYVIPNPPLYVQLVATPGSGALTVDGSYHTESLGEGADYISGSAAPGGTGGTGGAGAAGSLTDSLAGLAGRLDQLIALFGGGNGDPIGPLNRLPVDLAKLPAPDDPLPVIATVFTAPGGDQLTGTGTAQQPISVPCKLVRFKCDPANSTTIFLGAASTVTTAGLHALWAGGSSDDTGWIQADNVNRFWYIAASGSPIIYYWTMN